MVFFTLPAFIMGKAIARLVESTARRLRYEVTSTGVANEALIIPNAGGPSPDLRTDNSPPTGEIASPLHHLLEAAVTNQDQARAVLMGHQNVPGAPFPTDAYRARTTVIPREVPPIALGITTIPIWTVDVNEGAAAGDPASANHAVVIVQGPPTVGYTAEVEIFVPQWM